MSTATIPQEYPPLEEKTLIAGGTVKPDGEAGCLVGGQSLGEQAADHAGQDVADTACRHARVACRVYVCTAVRCCDHCTGPFQHQRQLMAAGAGEGQLDSVQLHISCRHTGETGHLSGMRGQNDRRFALRTRREMVGVSQHVQGVGVQYKRAVRFLPKRAQPVYILGKASQSRTNDGNMAAMDQRDQLFPGSGQTPVKEAKADNATMNSKILLVRAAWTAAVPSTMPPTMPIVCPAFVGNLAPASRSRSIVS